MCTPSLCIVFATEATLDRFGYSRLHDLCLAVNVHGQVVYQKQKGSAWELAFRCIMPEGYSMFACEGKLEVYLKQMENGTVTYASTVQ